MTDAIDDELELALCVDTGEMDDVAEVTGSEAAFLLYRDEARALPKGEVLGFRANASLAFHNVERGVKAISEEREMVEKLPGVDVKRLFDLPNLALGLVYAAVLASRSASEPSTSEYRTLLTRANAVRTPMLLALEACAAVGLLRSEEVAAIRRGQGSLDLAGDVVALAALYRKYADILKNKTPITAAHLEEADEVGDALLRFLKPKGTPVVKEPRSPKELVDDRDRMWTLLVRGHGELVRVAGFVLGGEAQARVPALQSRLRTVKKPAS